MAFSAPQFQLRLGGSVFSGLVTYGLLLVESLDEQGLALGSYENRVFKRFATVSAANAAALMYTSSSSGCATSSDYRTHSEWRVCLTVPLLGLSSLFQIAMFRTELLASFTQLRVFDAATCRLEGLLGERGVQPPASLVTALELRRQPCMPFLHAHAQGGHTHPGAMSLREEFSLLRVFRRV